MYDQDGSAKSLRFDQLGISVMKEMGFPPKFVDWIRAYVTTVSFSILVNDIPLKPFDAQDE